MQLIVFNPLLSTREETADLKVLWYHPSSIPLADISKTVGLAEAVTTLMSTFTHHNTQAMHTQRGRQVFLEAEPNFWFTLLVSHPARKSTTTPSDAKAASRKVKDETTEPLPASEEVVQDEALMAILRRACAMLRLACGPLQRIADDHGVDHVRSLLSQVMPLLIKHTLSPVLEDHSRPDVVDMLEGIVFLPVRGASHHHASSTS